MRRFLISVAAVGAATVALCAASVARADVFPTVAFSFDVNTFTYTYTVTQPTNATWKFGYLQIDTGVKNQAPTGPWQISGPFVNSVELPWLKGSKSLTPTAAFAYWQAPTPNDEIDNNLPDPWVGVFKLVVPNSQPVSGYSLTMDGADDSHNITVIDVPGPAVVPEPSSLIALGSAVCSGLMVIRRKK
ncbi:MAG: PEP-CTERM sorting domain-containing protein [Armatimonadetes bacterium]|nr:PEP-CTERM sorting domain-containing protein [Armatimonadota bacterium]